MAIIRRIAPASAFKIGLIAYAFLGLILGAFCSLVVVAGLPLAGQAHSPLARIGVFAVLVCPIVYGIIGGIVAAIGAAIYNLASHWVGGLEVELG